MIKHQISKGKDKALEAAKNTAKQIGEELVEIPIQAVKEAVGKKDTRPSPIVEAMKLKTEENENNDRRAAELPKRNLDYLEREIEDLKRKREMEEQQKLAEQQQVVEKEEKLQLLQEPPVKRKMGIPGFGKKKQKGTGEMLKSKK